MVDVSGQVLDGSEKYRGMTDDNRRRLTIELAKRMFKGDKEAQLELCLSNKAMFQDRIEKLEGILHETDEVKFELSRNGGIGASIAKGILAIPAYLTRRGLTKKIKGAKGEIEKLNGKIVIAKQNLGMEPVVNRG